MGISVIAFAKAIESCDLSDDALLHAGSATWEMWQNHVPVAVMQAWSSLNEETRAAVFLCCMSIAGWKKPEFAEFRDACQELINAEHYDHFAARMSDSELAAIEKMKALLSQGASYLGMPEHIAKPDEPISE